MTLEWKDRPEEVANLLNPAFCSIILKEGIFGYQQASSKPMPYSLLFLVLPIVLHKRTRELLPRSISTTFHAWVHRYESVRIGFSVRATDLVPYYKEALLFGVQSGLFSISPGGHVTALVSDRPLPEWPDNSEPFDCRRQARFVGRWMAKAGDEATIYSILGINV
jgi:hypothetical protein